MKIRAFGRTEKGLHLKNQDSFLVDVEKGVFAVADGVTLSKNSEQASQEAVKRLRRFKGDVESFFFEVNECVADLKDGTTTLTVAVVKGDEVEIGHVGDSALFLIREEVQKITEDDSIPGTNVLTQVIGGKKIRPHFYRLKIKKGFLLLATDGVTKYVTIQEIVDALQGRLEDAPKKLIDIAKKKEKTV